MMPTMFAANEVAMTMRLAFSFGWIMLVRWGLLSGEKMRIEPVIWPQHLSLFQKKRMVGRCKLFAQGSKGGQETETEM